MQHRRSFLASVVVALAGCTGTDDTTGGRTAGTPGGLSVTSTAFDDGETIPTVFTGYGDDRSPPLSIGGSPGATRSLAVVVDDPDAPSGVFVHWLLWNVPADRTDIPAGVPQRETLPNLGGARQGTNGFDEIGYRGPLPPAGDGPHTYRFTAYALDEMLDVTAGARRGKLEEAMADSVLASGRLTGTYERTPDR